MAKPDLKLILRCYRTGFSSSSQYLYQFALILVLNNLLMCLHGEGAVAVFNVVLNVSYVLIELYDSVGVTIQPLAATFYGERNQTAQRQTLRLALLWGGAIGVVCTGAIALFAPKIAAVFGLSAGMLSTGVLAIRCYCLGGLLAGPSMMLCSYWQAVEREKETLILTFLRSFAVYLLLAIPFSFGPLERFWWIFPATEAFSLLLFGLWQKLRLHGSMPISIRKPDNLPILQRMVRQGDVELGGLLEEVEEFCDSLGASIRQTYLATMAVEEMCQIIFLHTAELSQRDIYIQITLFPIDHELFELHIRDNAPAFDPFSLRLCRIDEAENEDSAMDSMGVLLVKKKCKEFYYRHYQGFNTLTVRI